MKIAQNRNISLFFFSSSEFVTPFFELKKQKRNDKKKKRKEKFSLKGKMKKKKARARKKAKKKVTVRENILKLWIISYKSSI